MNKNFILAVGLLAGTIIGAGIFSLPYVFSRVGLASGFFYLVIFTAVYFFIHQMYAQILTVDSGDDNNHQFFYLAHKHFKAPFANFSSFVILGELIFVMLVYLVLAPTFARIVFGEDGLLYLLAFWALGSVFIFAKLSWMELADFVGTASILGIIALVFFAGSAKGIELPAFRTLDLGAFFLPFGPLLFSLSGRPAIHKVVEVWRAGRAVGAPFSLKKTVFWGTAIPALIYAFFVISVLRLNPSVSPEALDSLGFLSPTLLVLLGVMGLITLWTSYFMIGINVKDIIRIDLKKPAWFAAALVLFIPLLLYFLGFREFLFVVTLAGSVFLALEAFFVIAMWQKTFPAHPLKGASWPLYLVFLAALIHEISTFIR